MSTERLQKELETYEKNKPSLLSSEGKFVLIHSEEIAGVWDTYKDALEAGYQKYALEPFLVKQIQGVEHIQFFSRELCPR